MRNLEFIKQCKSWLEFKNKLKPLSNKQKGDAFEILTKNFLELDPKYTTLLKHVWLLREVPSKIQLHLNLPNTDEGIDLIAETKDGEYWAIQSKYRDDETKSLSRKELSTFTDLTFSVCKNISFGLVCTTADRKSHKLKLYGDRLGFCTGEVWRGLDSKFFQRLHLKFEGGNFQNQALNPRPYQQRAIRNAQIHFEQEGNTRGKLIMPCGTGKSLTAYWIAESLKAKSILVVVPSLSLISQSLEMWTKEATSKNHGIGWIAVCSDDSVANNAQDNFVGFTHDLGIQVHTDPANISEWLRAKPIDSTKVVFCTYQSGRAIATAARKVGFEFDLGIFDEAHKTVGKKTSLFSHLLDNNNIKIKRRVFMTATERHYRGLSDEIASMDDPEIYGETFEKMSFKEAIEITPAILSDYKIVTIIVTQEEVANLIEENQFIRPDKGNWDEDIEARLLATIVALRKAIRTHPIQHTVSFHSSIKRALQFKAGQETFDSAFSQFGKLETFHVSGKTPTAVRSRILDEFVSSSSSLVTNARCLIEGIDIPEINCVLFADPKGSTVDIVQAVGRALRPTAENKISYIVVPVLLSSEIAEDAISEFTDFDGVLSVLKGL